jgi:Ni,Fe-hydrogenase III small subunit
VLKFLTTRWRQRTRTLQIPSGATTFPERFRGRPALDSARCGDYAACRSRMPSELLQIESDGRASLDVGACLFAPEEAAACPDGAIGFTTDHRTASSSRDGLRTRTGEIGDVAALDRRARALFGRSLRLRSVAAGSCNGCEAELVALGNVVFDMARFGVQFVASPRHADGMVVTGAVSLNMRDAVYRTYEAIPEPKLVIAVGACAINGGPFRGSPEVGDGVPADLPVDLWVPGCPPHPLTVLDGLLRLLARMPDPARPPARGPGGRPA